MAQYYVHMLTGGGQSSPHYNTGDLFRIELWLATEIADISNNGGSKVSDLATDVTYADLITGNYTVDTEVAYNALHYIKVIHTAGRSDVNGTSLPCVGTISNGVGTPQPVVAWDVFGPAADRNSACVENTPNDTLYTPVLNQPFNTAGPFYVSSDITVSYNLSGGWFKHIASGIVLYIDDTGTGYDNQLFSEEDTVNEDTETPGPGQSGDSC